jgi:hypothetical protein
MSFVIAREAFGMIHTASVVQYLSLFTEATFRFGERTRGGIIRELLIVFASRLTSISARFVRQMIFAKIN